MSDQQQPQMDAEQARQFSHIPAAGGVPGATGGTYTPEGEPVPEPAITGQQLVGALLALVFGMLADRRGEHWRLTETETEQLAKTGGALADHYMPQGNGPGAAFALCMGVALLPRMMVERAAIAERKEKERQQAAAEQAAHETAPGEGEGAHHGD
ncbi:hypothetical protein [uncultured Microbulbifer sp.]|uniref:hypothetical protein n=1 Tax=uncultured Microbulbifer sp. TaxID=348147 RepID=UPI002630126E|nr:hypothetical protein [uncultured Microbulbifer sp.]